MGGTQVGTAKLARKIASCLQFWDVGIVQVDTLKDLDPEILSNVNIALSLANLDSNII